jgi:hypothetical protein
MCPSALLLIQIERTESDILTILGTTHQRNRTSRFFLTSRAINLAVNFDQTMN